MSKSTLRLQRLREALASLGVGAWAVFHLWQEWSGFKGRHVWEAHQSSGGESVWRLIALLTLGLTPVIIVCSLDLILLRRREGRARVARALAENESLARRLLLIGTAATWSLAVFALYHAAWLSLPTLLGRSGPSATWSRLMDGLGTWPHAAAHAVGLTALTIHLWQSVPRAALTFGRVERAETRRAIRAGGLVLGLTLLALYAQLTGWFAAGAGTVWPMR